MRNSSSSSTNHLCKMQLQMGQHTKHKKIERGCGKKRLLKPYEFIKPFIHSYRSYNMFKSNFENYKKKNDLNYLKITL